MVKEYLKIFLFWKKQSSNNMNGFFSVTWIILFLVCLGGCQWRNDWVLWYLWLLYTEAVGNVYLGDNASKYMLLFLLSIFLLYDFCSHHTFAWYFVLFWQLPLKIPMSISLLGSEVALVIVIIIIWHHWLLQSCTFIWSSRI